MSKDYEYENDNFDDELDFEEEYEGLEIHDDMDYLELDLNEDMDHEDDFYDDYEEQEDFREVILTLDDDSELKCVVVAQYDVDGQDYIALLPVEDDQPGEILLYRASYDEDYETFEVELIEDEDEFQLATDGYYDNVDFDEDEYLDYQSGHHHHHHHDHDHHHHHHHDHDHDHYDEDEEDF